MADLVGRLSEVEVVEDTDPPALCVVLVVVTVVVMEEESL